MATKLKNETVVGNRSLSEQLIIDRLRFYFKKLEILPSDKTAIGKELDIYLPKFKIAIEVDGIFHSLPIHGEETLERIQTNDAKKTALCESKGIKLLRVILPKDSRVYPEFIKSEVINSLVPAIKLRMEEISKDESSQECVQG